MSSIKVVSINEEANIEPIEETKEEVVEEQVEKEEAKKEVVEPTNEVVDNTPVEDASPEARELRDPKEETKEEEIKQTTPENKKVQCPKCLKYMSNKNFRYRHEKLCTTEPKPVKPFSKPRAKPEAQPKLENTIETKASPPIKLTEEVSNQILKPEPQLSPYEVARQSYIHMREEMRQKKIEKINNFKAKMF